MKIFSFSENKSRRDALLPSRFEVIFAASPVNGAAYREPFETYHVEFPKPEESWFQNRLSLVRRQQLSFTKEEGK